MPFRACFIIFGNIFCNFIYRKQENKSTMPKTAILLGGSGAVGSELLQLLLADSRYEKIKLFAR